MTKNATNGAERSKQPIPISSYSFYRQTLPSTTPMYIKFMISLDKYNVSGKGWNYNAD
jgi:hypothetical protein